MTIEFFDKDGVLGTATVTDGDVVSTDVGREFADAWVTQNHLLSDFETFYDGWSNGYVHARRATSHSAVTASQNAHTIAFKFNPNQPRDSDGQWTDGGPGGSLKKLTSDEITQRGMKMDNILREARDLSTDRTHATFLGKGKGVAWHPDRDKVHREIVEDVYQRSAGAPNDGRAIIMGGPMGSGKTTTVRDHAGVDLGKYLVISPDDMKDELINRGLAPEIPDHPELSPLELSTLMHVETMRLAQMLAQRAYRDRKNIIWDISMGSYNAVKSHIRALDTHDYEHISAIVVDVPPHVSRARAYARYNQGVQDWQNGKGNGGRYIPRHILDDQHNEKGVSWGRDTLNSLKREFDAWMLYDNSVDGRDPKLIGKTGEVTA